MLLDIQNFPSLLKKYIKSALHDISNCPSSLRMRHTTSITFHPHWKDAKRHLQLSIVSETMSRDIQNFPSSPKIGHTTSKTIHLTENTSNNIQTFSSSLKIYHTTSKTFHRHWKYVTWHPKLSIATENTSHDIQNFTSSLIIRHLTSRTFHRHWKYVIRLSVGTEKYVKRHPKLSVITENIPDDNKTSHRY